MNESSPSTRRLPSDFSPPEEKHLGALTRRVLRAMAVIILPRSGRFNIECTDAIVNYVDGYTRYLPPLLRAGFPLGVWLFQLSSILRYGLPFSMLSRKRQESYVRTWVHSRFWFQRDLLKGLKGIMLMGYYQHPDVMALIDYDPDTHIKTVRARRFADYGHEIPS